MAVLSTTANRPPARHGSRLLHGAFSKCQVLRIVVAPSCKYFGTKVFEECCSLTQVGAAHCPSNKLAPQPS